MLRAKEGYGELGASSQSQWPTACQEEVQTCRGRWRFQGGAYSVWEATEGSVVDLVGSLRAYGAIASYVLFSPQSGALANVSGGFETGNPERGEFETYIGTFPVGF